jgi:hypothetical protein
VQDSVKERRHHQRHGVPVCAWLEFEREDAVRGMVTVDLSPEGAQFASLRPVRKGEPLLVSLQLEPGAQSIECKGRVCWAESMPNGLSHFGIRFTDLHYDECERLEQYLDETERKTALEVI